MGDAGEYFEQARKSIEELKQALATEQDEVRRQQISADIDDLEAQLMGWDMDYQPGTKEEEIMIRTRPHEKKEK